MRFVGVFAALLVLLSPVRAEREIEFAAQAGADDALIAAVTGPDDLDTLKAQMSAAAAKRLEKAVAGSLFTGEVGETASFLLGGERGEVHLIAVSAGAMARRDWADFGGRAGLIAKTSKAARIAVLAPGANAGDVAAAAEGAVLGAYAFNKYKSDAPPEVDGALVFIAAQPGPARAQFASEGRHRAEAVNWVRDMQSEPANVLYPEEFVRRAREAFRGVGRVSITVLDERDMARLGMNALLGVGRGSVRPPRLLIIRYNGAATGAEPLVFAGKGVTFDTGGISIKPNQGMWQMKSDMTGAAAVTGAVMSLAKSRAPVNVIAVAGLVENMPDGGAQRPGDVVRAMSGRTIEILSTDAEGRLVLADAIWYAQQEFNPALLVDVATLTGSVGRALGDEYAGLFSRDDAVAERLLAAGQMSGDDVWRLPLHPNHDLQIASLIADIKNADTGPPGASTGAAFIGAFVSRDTDWAHLDIAGVDWRLEPTATTPIGASGFGVRLLDRLARDEAE